jgi:hypothetical protein
LSVECPGVEHSRRPTLIAKPKKAWKAYRHMIRFYAIPEIMSWFEANPDLSPQDAAETFSDERVRDWENVGGQIVPTMRVYELIGRVKSGDIDSWKSMHAAYDALEAEYAAEKARHAWASLRDLVGKGPLEPVDLVHELERFIETTLFVTQETFASRKKDWDNPFRQATFRNPDEMRAVLGAPEGAKAVKDVRHAMDGLRSRALALIERLGER